MESPPTAPAELTPPGDEAGEAQPGGEQLPGQLFASLFLVAAALILVVLDPINIGFQPRLVESIVAVAIGGAIVAWGMVQRRLPVVLAGSAVLLAVCALAVLGQPVQLDVPPAAYLPLRVALLLLVVFAWAFLMSPPRWLRRAIFAMLVPTALLLLAFGGPSIMAQVTGSPFDSTTLQRMAPYWLAVDGHGTLYATDIIGTRVWAFDSSGSPKGTLQPANAPPVGTPGPGIIPMGYEAEINTLSTSTPTASPTATGAPTRTAAQKEAEDESGAGGPRRFDFCGIAADPQGNLYLVDLYDPKGPMVLRFDGDGNIAARWPAPSKYQPASGCLAADTGHVYLSSGEGMVYVYDHDGKEQASWNLGFQPLALSAATLADSPPGGGTLVAVGSTQIERLDVQAGKVVTGTLPPPPDQALIPALLTGKGELLLADHSALKVIRLDIKTGKVLGTIGEPGTWPGQLRDIGGLAEDQEGRIYVADFRNRVIQRFSPDGRVDAVWWARAQTTGTEGEEEER